MTKLQMNIDLFENIFGISCVENHYLSLIKFLDLPLEPIFYKSYIPITDTIHDFLNNKFTYLQYYELKRVFVTGKEIGIMEICSINSSFDNFINILEDNIAKGLPLLAMVDHNKLPKQGNVMPWRDDHFVSVIGYSEDSIICLDDTPNRKLEIEKVLFKDIFMSKCSWFNTIEEYEYEKFVREASLYIKKNIDNKKEIFEDLAICDENLLYFRDSIGILRISRNRIKIFLKWLLKDMKIVQNIIFDNLDRVIKCLDKLFVIIEACRLRKRINNNSINELLMELLELDYKWKNELSKILK